MRGFLNLGEDLARALDGNAPAGLDTFQVGKRSRSRPARSCYRNRLAELIQYAPTTETVRPEPIADRAGLDHEVLHPRSLAGELAGEVPDQQGFTVFMISWKNPDRRGPRLSDGRLPYARGDGRRSRP